MSEMASNSPHVPLSHSSLSVMPPLIHTNNHDESFASNNSSDECNTSGETIDLDVCMQTPTTTTHDVNLTFHSSASVHPTASSSSSKQPLVSAFASQHMPTRAHSAHVPIVPSTSTAASMISTLPTLPLQHQQPSSHPSHHQQQTRPHSPQRPTRDPAMAPRFTHTMSSKKQKFDAHFATSASSSSAFNNSNFPQSSSLFPSSDASAMQLQQPCKQARQVSQMSVSNLNQYRGLDEDSDTEEDEVSLSQRSNSTIPLIPSLPNLMPHSHHPSMPTAAPSQQTPVFIMPTDVDLSAQPVAGLNDYIRLNVGGQLFQTTFQTLLSQPNSYFTSRFGSGRFQEPPSSFDSSYFIDRDGTHFRHILNYMRDLVCAVTDYDSLQEILREARFYQLDNLAKIVQDKISDINIERMNLDNNTSSSNSAANKPEPQTTTVVSMQLPSPSPGFMQGLMAHTRAPGANQQHMGHGGQNRLVLHPQAHYQRNLFVSRWGTGGMAGAGPTTVTTPITTTVVPASASSSSASHAHDDSVMMMSHMSPAHPSGGQSLRPVRTSSCPSQLNGFHAPSASSGSVTPIAAAPASSFSNGNAEVHHGFSIPQLQQVHQPQQQLIATMPPPDVFSHAHLSTLDPASQAQLMQFQSMHHHQQDAGLQGDKPFVFSIEEDF